MQAADLVPPLYVAHPTYEYTLGEEVADLCTAAGYEPDPEQELALNHIFGIGPDGKSTAFETAVLAPRQNLKTGLFKQCVLGWLFLTDQRLVVWSAHEFSTAQEAFRDIEELIGGQPWLARRVKKISYSAGSEGIELVTGQRIRFRARTKTGGRGLTGDKVVLDEAFALEPSHIASLLPTLSARPDPQLVYGSSAGTRNSHVLRGVRDRGRAGTSPRLAYFEWAAPVRGCAQERCEHQPRTPGCQLDDRDNWKRANPLLGRVRANGTTLTEEYIAAERDAFKTEVFDWARERLGWWDDATGGAAVFSAGKWEACLRTTRPPEVPVEGLALAVSVAVKDRTVTLAAAGQDLELTWVKPLRHGPGTGWVLAAARELQDRYRLPIVVDGRGPASALIPVLEAGGVEIYVVDTGEVLDACDGFHTLVEDELLRYETAEELDRAVAGAVRREVGDRWAWGRRKSTSNIDPLEAVTLATWYARTVGATGRSVYEDEAHGVIML